MSLCAALYIGLGIGIQPSQNREQIGREPTSVIRVECQIDDNWTAEWNHHSSVRDGAPFNKRYEAQVDVLSIVYRFKVY